MREFMENGGAEEGVWASLSGIMQECEAPSGYVAFAAAAYAARHTQAETFAACVIIRRMCDRAIDEIEAALMEQRPFELA
jgi:hypothetical protein